MTSPLLFVIGVAPFTWVCHDQATSYTHHMRRVVGAAVLAQHIMSLAAQTLLLFCVHLLHSRRIDSISASYAPPRPMLSKCPPSQPRRSPGIHTTICTKMVLALVLSRLWHA